MANAKPPADRRLEAVFESAEEKARIIAAAAAIPMHASRYAAKVLLTSTDTEATKPRAAAPYRAMNALRIAALEADALLAKVTEPASRDLIQSARDRIADGLALLT